MSDEAVNPVGFSGVHGANCPTRSVPFQGPGDEFAQAGEKVDAHTGMKAVRVDTADRDKTDVGLVPERHECSGADLLGVVLEKEVALVIDIGGGSTELSWVDVRKLNSNKMSRRISRPPISAWTSLPVGVVNLSEMYPEDPDDLAGWFQSMKDYVLEKIDENDCANRFSKTFQEGRGHLVGTSGTITSLAGVHLKLPYYQRNKIDGIWVEAKHIMSTAERLSTMSLEERQQEPCIGTDRATMLVAGCAILDVIYDLWPSERFRVADRGLREGMLMGLMNKTQIRPHGHNNNGSQADTSNG